MLTEWKCKLGIWPQKPADIEDASLVTIMAKKGLIESPAVVAQVFEALSCKLDYDNCDLITRTKIESSIYKKLARLSSTSSGRKQNN